MKIQLVKLGTFEVTSGKLIVSDPCYTEFTEERWLARKLGHILPAVNGTWRAYASICLEGDAHGRVAALLATHHSTDTGSFTECRTLQEEVEVDVDSGQLSIVCAALRPLTEEENGDMDDEASYYGCCCKWTMSVPGAGIIPGGCVSSSGFGDGGYNCTVTYEQGPGPCRAQLVNSVRVDFITERDLRPDDAD
jgi:hypothetical protein